MLDMDLIDLILISGYGSNGPIWSNSWKKKNYKCSIV